MKAIGSAGSNCARICEQGPSGASRSTHVRQIERRPDKPAGKDHGDVDELELLPALPGEIEEEGQGYMNV